SLMSVNSSSRLGNTENSTGLRMFNAVSRTKTEAVRLKARSRSSARLGRGTSITNTIATTAEGRSQSEPDPRHDGNHPALSFMDGHLVLPRDSPPLPAHWHSADARGPVPDTPAPEFRPLR